MHHIFIWCVSIFVVLVGITLFNTQRSAAAEPLITTWKTDTQYPSGDSLLFLINPIYHGAVNYVVDWGDGTNQTNITGDAYHEYASPGTYTVKIDGDFPGFYFKTPIHTPELLVSVDSWGDIVWKNADYAFAGATVMKINATDVPNLSETTTLQSMFKNALYLNDPINDWDVSNVVNFEGMFEGAQHFNQSLNGWGTSSAQTMKRMFYNAQRFNQDISNWDTANLITTYSMFERAYAFNQNLGAWDISSLEGPGDMFSHSGMQLQQYDDTLRGWAEQLRLIGQNSLRNTHFRASGLEFCEASDEREILAREFNWIFIDDTQKSALCSSTQIRFSGTDVSDLSIGETTKAGSVIGQLTVGDDENGANYSFDLQCQNPAVDTQFFEIQGSSLVLTLKLDFEQPKDADADNSYRICVRVSDQLGNTHEQIMTVRIDDAPPAEEVQAENEDSQQNQAQGQVLGVNDGASGSSGSSVKTPGEVLAESDSSVLASTGTGLMSALIVGSIVIIIATVTLAVKKMHVYRVYN